MRYAGIDISSETLVVAVVAEDEAILVKPTSFDEDRGGYEYLFQVLGVPDGVIVAMEATGGSWRNVAAALFSRGYGVALVVRPPAGRLAGDDPQRTRTGTLDAMGLARFARRRRPPATRVPRAAAEQLRELFRLRERLVEDRSERALQLDRLAKSVDAAEPSVDRPSSEAHRVQLRYAAEDVELLRRRLRELDADIGRRLDDHGVGKILTTVDGLDTAPAERPLVDPRVAPRFDSAQELASYLESASARSQPGAKNSQPTPIVGGGDPPPRQPLLMPILRSTYSRLLEAGNHPKVALGATEGVMVATRCPDCGGPRDVYEPCPRCGAPVRVSAVASAPDTGRSAAVSREPKTEPVEVDRLGALTGAVRSRPPRPDDSGRRLSTTERRSPRFAEDAHAPAPAPIKRPAAVEFAPSPSNPPLEVHLDARFEVPSAPADEEPLTHLLLSITPEGPPLLDPSVDRVAHVILVLDLSASMNHPDKYPMLTEALAGMLYELRSQAAADVLLSVVVYAYGSETIFRDVCAKEIDPRDVLAAIDRSSLRFGRYTDVVGALDRAGKIAHDSLRANRAMPVRIYLLTDGKPQDMDGAIAKVGTISRMPVDLDALAFGNDADVAALRDLVAGRRGGTVKQIRSETLGEAFGRIGEVSQHVVANRALLSVELRNGVVGGSASRFRPARHRFGDDAFVGGTSFQLDLGTLESGRPYQLLFELRLPRGKPGVETDIGRVSLRLPGFGGPRTYEKHLSLPRHPGGDTTPDPEVVAARDVLAAFSADDPAAMLRSLKIRRRLYEEERRDRHLITVLDKAIAELEERGSLAALSASEHAALLSHTCTAGGDRPVRSNRGSTPR